MKRIYYYLHGIDESVEPFFCCVVDIKASGERLDIILHRIIIMNFHHVIDIVISLRCCIANVIRQLLKISISIHRQLMFHLDYVISKN